MRQQKGYTLLELILVMGLLASMTILSFQEKSLEIEQKKLLQSARKSYSTIMQLEAGYRKTLGPHQQFIQVLTG